MTDSCIPEYVNGAATADGHSHDQSPEVIESRLGKLAFESTEKGFSFTWDVSDSNHAAYSSISSVNHKTYRQDRPHFFYANYQRKTQIDQFELIKAI